ncbi:farnesyl diphosphate synthase [Hydrogenoanaerobacterium sp.]|uniref:polyprenyl synthetase family protein n=1 Tax=Hydrogenoanaerobacterium sp. TaxID=2953763 RepID=UPI0028A09DB1|nr:farnesyl diphosphate synthase [Hydrogenoanaerobacterium sp.]
MLGYDEKYKRYLTQIDCALDGYLNETDTAYQSVISAMRYSALGAGKRVRAILLIEFCKACGGTEQLAMPFACALEMIHAYSLIHDDLPCMDNDELRRGKPSCWKAFGETTALLAGDGLLTKAFEAAAGSTAPAECALRATLELAQNAGTGGMLGGQVIDLEGEGKPVDEVHLLQMYSMKTGALINAAAKIGCILAGVGEEKINLAHRYAEKIGLAFQIVDDILDVAGDQETLGKPIGSDVQSEKTTFATLHDLEYARNKALRLTKEAREILNEFTMEDEFLYELTDRLAVREN